MAHVCSCTFLLGIALTTLHLAISHLEGHTVSSQTMSRLALIAIKAVNPPNSVSSPTTQSDEACAGPKRGSLPHLHGTQVHGGWHKHTNTLPCL